MSLGDSKDIAIKRFYSLERKFRNDPTLRNHYIQFMREYESLGHMTRIETDDCPDPSVYLPHHGVIKESSKTTRLRTVFDASSKTSTGLSLNDVLKVGPCIQDSLFNILIRFRKFNVVITADIEKMYRQINIHPDQRHLQRIVWRPDSNGELKEYNLNTVTYGMASSSFLATRSLFQVAIENEKKHPLIAEIIKHDFYMDDLLSGANSLTEACEIKRVLSNLLLDAGFLLRKWLSNHPGVLDSFSPNTQYYINDDNNAKTLGIFGMQAPIRYNIQYLHRQTKVL